MLPCTNCTRYDGTLASGGQAYHPGSGGFTWAGGTLKGYLRGPAGADFDLYLERYRSGLLGGWSAVATADSASNNEDIVNKLAQLCRDTDRAAAALVTDLKQRGLLDSTLVVWGGEFGRTPMNEERGGSKFLGRDHHPRAFTMWLAGAGIKPGVTVGATDDIGYNIAEDPVSVHDLHATILHLLGLDHTKLTYRFQGREFRLTDVHGELVRKLLV